MKKISNKTYDKIGEELDSYLEEHLEVTTNPEQTNEIIQIVLRNIKVEKERL